MERGMLHDSPENFPDYAGAASAFVATDDAIKPRTSDGYLRLPCWLAPTGF